MPTVTVVQGKVNGETHWAVYVDRNPAKMHNGMVTTLFTEWGEDYVQCVHTHDQLQKEVTFPAYPSESRPSFLPAKLSSAIRAVL